MQKWNSIRTQILSIYIYALLYISFEWENERIVHCIPDTLLLYAPYNTSALIKFVEYFVATIKICYHLIIWRITHTHITGTYANSNLFHYNEFKFSTLNVERMWFQCKVWRLTLPVATLVGWWKLCAVVHSVQRRQRQYQKCRIFTFCFTFSIPSVWCNYCSVFYYSVPGLTCIQKKWKIDFPIVFRLGAGHHHNISNISKY